MKKKILVVFGTRPEAVKMCPVIKELQAQSSFQVTICVTGQHRELLTQMLSIFDIKPDIDLAVMKPRQNLIDLTTVILEKIQVVLKRNKPDIVLIHGDTTTALATALACFYLHIPIGHIEAGLRTYDLTHPFPEEFNRQTIGLIAQYHFAPTERAKNYLIQEGRKSDKIYVTGNTAIDTFQTTLQQNCQHELIDWIKEDRLLLLTAHRREALGLSLIQVFRALRRIVDESPNVKVIFPVHPNPKLHRLANDYLSGHERIRLIPPLSIVEFHHLLSHSYLVITDSGGIQEEAPALGKPVLVIRETTEREEGVELGSSKLIGTNETVVYKEINRLLKDFDAYEKMSQSYFFYGDGNASKRITEILLTNTIKKC